MGDEKRRLLEMPRAEAWHLKIKKLSFKAIILEITKMTKVEKDSRTNIKETTVFILIARIVNKYSQLKTCSETKTN